MCSFWQLNHLFLSSVFHLSQATGSSPLFSLLLVSLSILSSVDAVHLWGLLALAVPSCAYTAPSLSPLLRQSEWVICQSTFRLPLPPGETFNLSLYPSKTALSSHSSVSLSRLMSPPQPPSLSSAVCPPFCGDSSVAHSEITSLLNRVLCVTWCSQWRMRSHSRAHRDFNER